MLRKSLMAIVAAGTMALGVSAATSTAEASHRHHNNFGFYFGFPMDHNYHGGYHGNYHCHYKRVKVWNRHHTRKIWVTVKTRCHRTWH